MKEFISRDTWVKPYIQQYKKTLMFSVFLGVLTFIFGGALMFSSGCLITKSASLPENIIVVYVPVVLTRAFGIFRPAFRYFERLTSHNWVLKMTSSLRKKLYVTLESQSMLVMNKIKLGEVLGILSEDIANIQNLYLRSIFPSLVAFLLSIFLSVALGFLSISFAILLFGLLLVLLAVFPIVHFLVQRGNEARMKATKINTYAKLTDFVLGVNDIIISGRGDEFSKEISKVEEEYRESQRRVHEWTRIRTLLFEIAFILIVVVLLVWATAEFQQKNVNLIAAFTLALFPLVDAFATVGDVVVEAEVQKGSIDRMNDLNVQEIERNVDKVTPNRFNLTFDKVNFTYEKNAVFEDFSLTVAEGEFVALLGKSGGGKSTLLHLLRGDLTADSGECAIGGIPVKSVGEKMPEIVGVIDQVPYLFHTTIRNNLRIGKLEASDEELWSALEKVELKELVASLPQGLDTVVKEGAIEFSGGERHRLSLARILLKDTPVVLLDEVTTALDPITERNLVRLLIKELHGKTVLWVTHHLLGVEESDRVVFIENGKVKMDGTHEQLAKENEYYQTLLKLDRGDVDGEV